MALLFNLQMQGNSLVNIHDFTVSMYNIIGTMKERKEGQQRLLNYNVFQEQQQQANKQIKQNSA